MCSNLILKWKGLKNFFFFFLKVQHQEMSVNKETEVEKCCNTIPFTKKSKDTDLTEHEVVPPPSFPWTKYPAFLSYRLRN